MGFWTESRGLIGPRNTQKYLPDLLQRFIMWHTSVHCPDAAVDYRLPHLPYPSPLSVCGGCSTPAYRADRELMGLIDFSAPDRDLPTLADWILPLWR